MGKNKNDNRQKNEFFINPYTFVPIQAKNPDRHKVETGDKTGVIECVLETKSPVFIPNTTKKYETETKEHYKYEFYSYDDLSETTKNTAPKKPVIPGSEIRGVIRNIYEQLTNSCFMEVDEKNLPYKRTPQPKLPAVMEYENGKWVLYTKPDIKNVPIEKIGQHMKQGLKMNIEGNRSKAKVDINPNGEYVLHLTGKKIGNEKYKIAFALKQYGKPIPVSSDALERFKNVIDSYCDEKVNKSPNSKNDITNAYNPYRERFENKKPIFVYTDETHTYLSPSCMTKEYFVNTIDKILEKQNEHNKCNDKNELCPACRLFGMIGKNGANVGRLRFTDTYDGENIKFESEITLPILGTPRISATEFYLERPNNEAKMWNYDYYMDDYPKIKINGRSVTQYKPIPYDAKLRGRKVYWHGKWSGDSKEPSNMNCTVRPLKAGVKFKFKVYFEKLTDEELKNLIFALRLNGEGLQKIGKGKPIGMGDIKIDISAVKYKEYVLEDGCVDTKYVEDNELNTYNMDETDTIVAQILKYTKPMSKEDSALVAYPTNKSGDKIYEWFGKNRGNSIQKPEIQMILPKITSPKQAIEKHENRKKNNTTYNNNGYRKW